MDPSAIDAIWLAHLAKAIGDVQRGRRLPRLAARQVARLEERLHGIAHDLAPELVRPWAELERVSHPRVGA